MASVLRTLLAAMILVVVPAFAAPAPGDLCAAVLKRDVEKVKALLADGAPVDDRGAKGATALMLASEIGRADLVKLLLAAGADAKATREGAITALHHAAATGTPEIVALLIAAKADVNAVATAGRTPLHSALAYRRLDIARVLMAAGARNDAGPAGAEALVLVLNERYSNSSMGESETPAVDIEFLKALMAAGAKIDAKDSRGYTALHMVAAARQPQLVEFLLQRGAKPNEMATDGTTPLLLAAKSAGLESASGGISFILTIMSDSTRGEVAKLDMRTTRKRNIIRKALETLIGKGSLDPQFADLARRRKVVLEQLIKAGADPNLANKEGNTPLSEVAYNGDVGAAETLLAGGAKADYVRPGGFSVLARASAEGNDAIVRVLLAHGASVDLVNEKGETALMRAAISGGDGATVAVLLAAHANVNARNADGETALIYALGGHPDYLNERAKINPEVKSVVEQLLAAGADPTIADAKGRTPLELSDTDKYEAARPLLKAALKKLER